MSTAHDYHGIDTPERALKYAVQHIRGDRAQIIEPPPCRRPGTTKPPPGPSAIRVPAFGNSDASMSRFHPE